MPPLLSRLLYGAAFVLIALGILVITDVWKTSDTAAITFFIAGGICGVAGVVFDYPRWRGPRTPV